VVHDVVLDDSVEDVAADEAEFTINGGKRALDESPLVGLVMRSILVGVVQVRNRD
jgi:hypothetical protein